MKYHYNITIFSILFILSLSFPLSLEVYLVGQRNKYIFKKVDKSKFHVEIYEILSCPEQLSRIICFRGSRTNVIS